MSDALLEPISVDLNQTVRAMEDRVASLRCFLDITDDDGLDFCEYENLNAYYARALHILRKMMKDVKQIRADRENFMNQRLLIEDDQKLIPEVTKLLHRANAEKPANSSFFPRIGEVVDYFDAVTDHLFLLLGENSAMNHYAVLGVSRDAGADEIKRAYYARTRELFPDTLQPISGKDLDSMEKLRKNREYEIVLAAYDVLSDPVRRDRYDQLEDPFANYKKMRAKHDGRKQIDRTWIVYNKKE